MPGLKKYFPDIRFGGNKITPDELDVRKTYQVTYPSISASSLGTAAAGTVDVAWSVVNTTLDYPRNLLYTVTGGTTGGTTIVNGKDQFGVVITETVTIATAAAGGTAAGTKVFSTFTSGTHYTNGGDNTSTAVLGYAKGTAAGIVAVFGLPVRVGAVSDVKRLTWSNVGTVTSVNGGTINSTYVGTANHTFQGSAVVAATDIYVVD